MNTNNKLSKTQPIKLKRKIKKLKKQKKKLKTALNFRPRRRRNRRMPAAFTKSFSKFFRIVRQDGNSMIVRGRDLVYSIPDSIEAQYQDSNVITIIPCNPCYWTGTRVSAIANGYQNYRPLKFNVHYVPQCAVTQQGNVLCGTIWNQTPTSDNLQQSLRTSSGGMLTQCYKGAKSIVTMRSNLQYNLYRCGGKFDQESNPFLFMALAIGCQNSSGTKIIPGYFYVEWEYAFKNPIGYSTTFTNSGLEIIGNMLNLIDSNATFVSCQSIPEKKIEVGMIIQVDLNEENKLEFTYNDTYLDIDTEDPIVGWAFTNKPLTSITTLTKEVPIQVRPTVKVFYSNKSVLPSGYECDPNNFYIYEDPLYVHLFLKTGDKHPIRFIDGRREILTVTVTIIHPSFFVGEFLNYDNSDGGYAFAIKKEDYDVQFIQVPAMNKVNKFLNKAQDKEKEDSNSIVDSIKENLEIQDD
jgi:hypothetical protein